MATTPRGDDSELRRSVIGDLARAVARQQLAGSAATPPGRPRKLRATYLRAAPTAMARALPKAGELVTSTEPALVHPEWVNGRRLWMDTPMHDLISRIRFGDPVKGWEGDTRLSIYFNGDERRFELWRLEDDNTYRIVCRSTPGMTFDDRVIDALIAWDGRRRARPLAEQVIDHNTRLDEQRSAARDEWVAEDLAPRLHHAFRREL